MLYRIMLSFYGLIIATMMVATQAQAVSLGKIEVASHLGEPFFAEVPLALDEGEEISSMYIELASPADYRVLEVYRDQTLNNVRADVLSDSRGTRVELTSFTTLDSPFFNLVLKVRYGRATHYKKYPVFLDLPKSTQPSATAKTPPTISVEEAAVTGPIVTVSPVTTAAAEQPAATEEAPVTSGTFTPFDGWARTGHYGPMVYGDTISTVADRLRIDNRYSRNQVMVAIFEKNRSKFDQDNINLIKAGTHLDIPMADEVERISPNQAREIMQDHNQRWKELTKQPRYAAVEEAQKNRYSKRVRAGKNGSGVASSPVSGEADKPDAGDQMTEQPTVEPVEGMDSAGTERGSDEGTGAAEITALNASVSKLEQENEALKAKLAESDAKVTELKAAGTDEASKAAAEARNKKLELQIARLQSELDNARQKTSTSEGPDWLMLIGGGLVLLLIGGGAGYMMRRERKHPAMDLAADRYEPAEEMTSLPMEPSAPEMFAEEIDVEPVEDFTPDFSDMETHSDTEAFEDGFTDSIPDLTDEETGEMEAFKEDLEEEPDPNVDYLSEADVYMRYGMEDEAEKQVQMALKLRENNKDAHVKLVQIKKARGDEGGADEAIATARMVLVGDALTTFEQTVANLSTGGSSGGDIGLEDTIPPGTLDVSEDPKAHESVDSSSTFDDLADIEFEQEEVPISSASEVPRSDEAETMELGDFDFPASDQTIQSETELESEALPELESEQAPAKVADDEIETEALEDTESTIAYEGEPEGLDFDLSGLELPEDNGAGVESAEEPEWPMLEDEEAPVVEPKVIEAAESMDDDGLNLSDLDLTGESEAQPASPEAAGEELQTADLDKTLVMDWSKDTVTSGDYEVGGESGAGEIDLSFDLDTMDEGETASAEPSIETIAESADEIEEPEEHLSSVEFDLEDLNVDLDTPVSSDDVDDFSSTIQTSTAEIQASAVLDEKKSDAADIVADEEEEAAGVSFDLGDIDTKEPKAHTASKGPSLSKFEALDHDATVRINVDAMSLEDIMGAGDDDFDATMELDSLMKEFDKDDDSGNKGKKS